MVRATAAPVHIRRVLLPGPSTRAFPPPLAGTRSRPAVRLSPPPDMKITAVEALHCDAGWRPWTFIKIATDDGAIGWSECTDSHGSPRGIQGAVNDLAALLIGQDPRDVERLYWLLYSRTRQSAGSVIQKAIGGIENALLDIKAKDLGISVVVLF